MKFLSTRDPQNTADFSKALVRGVAPDGGLYVPDQFPQFQLADFDGAESWAQVGKILLAPFFKGDALESKLAGICDRAFDFKILLKRLAHETSVLELFHGPTAAFKDVGARFLAECLQASPAQVHVPHQRMVLVATSGDTGGAVAAAFFEKPGFDVVILYPLGKISPRQEKQLNAWGKNVRAFAVRGNFDDCQRMVKEAFGNPEWSYRNLISANSINLGRILPQMVYYAWASLTYLRKYGQQTGLIVPSGNLGNATAAFWAAKMGLPIRAILLATNTNHAIADAFETGKWQPKPTVHTLANAMDVGSPSNMERLLKLHSIDELKRVSGVQSVTDAQIADTIRRGPTTWGEIWCPHTATAVFYREQLSGPDWTVVATAHPAKFDSIVEPLVGSKVQVPRELQNILERPSVFRNVEPQLKSLDHELSI